MIHSEATFDGTFPFAPHFTPAPGFQMHYADEGPRDGDVVLCLHGEPTWGYLFRHLISVLSKTHRVLVPDHWTSGRARRPRTARFRPRISCRSSARFSPPRRSGASPASAITASRMPRRPLQP